ncbi:unnamed protein product [Rotaria sordida]|uniref:Uncharacterized protein n=1 Tax=Rotaria sordida TaxID=392033 RepID=A0A819WPS2_9BILA|nr:unnamed protein product [Rotaria sordida]CAF1480305.1 unnamed protein product [Rotaria sordida]CAF1485143.1 unnamed protein product [Rotaria sordida]CAF4041228.1 unnamed protein product [Rotaria sordida]CAF4073752.1 unnamed protein product [Rotaria sordida]
MDDNTLEYIDYSVDESVMDTRSSNEFFHSQLQGYSDQCSLSLPFYRHRLSTDQQSVLPSTGQIIFDDDMSSSFLNYASLHYLTLFQLGLAIFYAFLFKLT